MAGALTFRIRQVRDEARPWVRHEIVPERVAALLVKATLHDLMRIYALQPTVQHEHDGYAGHDTGDMIGEPRVALSYLMDKFPETLEPAPSLASRSC